MRAALFLSLVTLFACSAGKTGPAGSTGATGATGSTGGSGSNGTNGTNGTNELVRIDVEPPGANCPNGGEAIHTGLDLNGNGKLDDDEITSTTYVCSLGSTSSAPTMIYGDVNVSNSLELAQLAGVTTITGELNISVPAKLTMISLPDLVEVGGLNVQNNSVLATLALPALKTVDATIEIDDYEDTLGTITLGSLTSAAALYLTGGTYTDLGAFATLTGSMDVTLKSTALTTAALPNITHIGSLTVTSNEALTTLTGLSLNGAMNAITIGSNTKLTDMSALAPVTSVKGTLSLDVVPASVDLSTALGGIEGASVLELDNLAVTTLTIANLATVGTLTVSSAPSLTKLALPAMTTISNYSFFGVQALTEIDWPKVTSLSTLEIDSSTPALTTFDLSALATADNVIVSGGAVTSLSLPALTSITGSFQFGGAPTSTISMPLLASASTISLGNYGSASAVTSVDFSALATVATLSIAAVGATSLAFPKLATVSQELAIESCPSLDLLSMPALQTAKEFFVVYNTALPNCQPQKILTALEAPPTQNQVANNGTGTCM